MAQCYIVITLSLDHVLPGGPSVSGKIPGELSEDRSDFEGVFLRRTLGYFKAVITSTNIFKLQNYWVFLMDPPQWSYLTTGEQLNIDKGRGRDKKSTRVIM